MQWKRWHIFSYGCPILITANTHIRLSITQVSLKKGLKIAMTVSSLGNLYLQVTQMAAYAYFCAEFYSISFKYLIILEAG